EIASRNEAAGVRRREDITSFGIERIDQGGCKLPHRSFCQLLPRQMDQAIAGFVVVTRRSEIDGGLQQGRAELVRRPVEMMGPAHGRQTGGLRRRGRSAAEWLDTPLARKRDLCDQVRLRTRRVWSARA